MSDAALTNIAMTRMAARIAPKSPMLLAGAAMAALAATRFGWSPLGFGMVAAASTLCGLFLLLRGLLLVARVRTARLHRQIGAIIANDRLASFATDADGTIMAWNSAAAEQFGSNAGQSLNQVLGEVFACPGSVILRLRNRTEAHGAARQEVAARQGLVRLSVHQVSSLAYLWRLEDLSERAGGARSGDGIGLPMLVASRQGAILSTNDALRQLAGGRAATLERLFGARPLLSGEEREITGPQGAVRVQVTEVQGRGGRREIYLTPSPGGPGADHDPVSFEALPVALLRLDERGTIVAANRAARAMIGDPPAGALLSALFDGLGRPVADWLRDALAGRAERRPETLRLKTEGEEIFVQVALARTIDGGQPGLAAILTDATQIKTLEAQVVQSQKMQAIGQLAGGVAHDFNNLLTAISGHCDLLLLRHDHGDPDYADLNQIAQNANRAAALVSQLLAFSRKQTLRPAVIDLRDTLADLTHLLNRLVGEQVTLTLQHDPDLRPVRVDRRQLEQVVMNLVVNARDAMPRGGRVTLATRNLRLESDLRRDRATVPAGDYVLIEVRDEGCGIPPDRIEKIFEPFFTTKRPGEGTGLGLSTAYGIVKQSGGFVFCDSAVDQGTLFTLYFPASDRSVAEPAEPAPQVAAGTIPSAGGSVLLVEDEAPVRAFAGRALRMRGFTVVEAETAEDALRILDDRGLSVDVFVTDVIMPGLDGPAWVRRALEDRPGTRVVFMSGYSEESLADARDRIPNSVFLPKPFTLSELTATVQRQMQ